MCGYGGGAFILNFIVTGFINPHNLSPDLEESGGEKLVQLLMKPFFSICVLIQQRCLQYILKNLVLSFDEMRGQCRETDVEENTVGTETSDALLKKIFVLIYE